MKKLLVIAPHPDDEVLGCGGTIARFSKAGGEVHVLTVAAHMPPIFPESVHLQTLAEARRAHALLGVTRSHFMDKPAVLLDQTPVHELNAAVKAIVDEASPDVLLLPYCDRHIDHRQIFDAALVAARPVGTGRAIRMVAAYETLSETHWNAPHVEPNFTPNWCVDIGDTLELKLQAMQCYESQVHPFPAPRSLDALRALALFRGSQAGMGYAEGFHVLRLSAPAELL